jgi:hypothetical protein
MIANLHEGLCVMRHPLVFNAHPVVLLDYLTRLALNHKLPPIKLRENNLAAAQRINQRQLMHQKQVVPHPLEGIVLLLLQLKHNITRLHGGIVAHTRLAAQHNTLPVFHALLNVDLKDLRTGGDRGIQT